MTPESHSAENAHTESSQEADVMDTPWAEIDALIEAADDYQTTAEAARDAAVKAFNYAASRCGLTGFQAGWAALSFYGEVMSIKGPYALFKAEDLLYPQYDLPGRLREWMSSDEMRTWLADEAQKKLDSSHGAIGSVVAHWVELVADRPDTPVEHPNG